MGSQYLEQSKKFLLLVLLLTTAAGSRSDHPGQFGELLFQRKQHTDLRLPNGLLRAISLEGANLLALFGDFGLQRLDRLRLWITGCGLGWLGSAFGGSGLTQRLQLLFELEQNVDFRLPDALVRAGGFDFAHLGGLLVHGFLGFDQRGEQLVRGGFSGGCLGGLLLGSSVFLLQFVDLGLIDLVEQDGGLIDLVATWQEDAHLGFLRFDLTRRNVELGVEIASRGWHEWENEGGQDTGQIAAQSDDSSGTGLLVVRSLD
ncbi:AAEL014496-PA [Aedes aegypti]|uniref:AAEL014496-PA n=1 Tax=Aedes aegypti TaxID=7159 RepID=Q16G78_AEDAE|nr:AAEL014496-PA [Aedes aegypti]